MSKGIVAKAFRFEEERDEAYDGLRDIPHFHELAGLAYPSGSKEDNTS